MPLVKDLELKRSWVWVSPKSNAVSLQGVEKTQGQAGGHRVKTEVKIRVMRLPAKDTKDCRPHQELGHSVGHLPHGLQKEPTLLTDTSLGTSGTRAAGEKSVVSSHKSPWV